MVHMFPSHNHIFSNLNLPLQNMDPEHNFLFKHNNGEWYGHSQWTSGGLVDDNQPRKRNLIILNWKYVCFTHSWCINTRKKCTNYTENTPIFIIFLIMIVYDIIDRVSPPDILDTKPVQELWNTLPRTPGSIFINHKQ